MAREWYKHPMTAAVTGTAAVTSGAVLANILDEKKQEVLKKMKKKEETDEEDVVTKVAAAMSARNQLLLWGGLPALVGGGLGLYNSKKRRGLGKFSDMLRGSGAGASVGLGVGAGGHLGAWAGEGLGDGVYRNFVNDDTTPGRADSIATGSIAGRLGGSALGGLAGWKLAQKLGLTEDLFG